ncbi:MAG: NUDIX hydrolase, partial [Clostridia bacterium]|nr:NUDIX hydrolase [Clostridia bacterium]
MTEKTIKSENVFKGKVINLNIETVELPNGNTSTREIVSHSGGVGILAVDNDKNAYMVTQFRSPYKKLVLEVPAGKLNKGESHLECGIRELREETGLEAEE